MSTDEVEEQVGVLVEVDRSGPVAAPARVVWATVGDFGSADRYFPSILECRTEGEGVGALRHLRTDIGGTTTSELIELDDDLMAMGYRVVESTVPIEEYTARVVVVPDGENCRIDYSCRCRPRSGTEKADLERFLGDQLDSAIEGLRRLHEV